MTATQNIDILLLGPTGYTGRLILRYLAAHPGLRSGDFKLALGGRSLAKLKQVATECGIDLERTTVRVIEDVTDVEQVRTLISDVRVVISAVGPFWRYGRALVRACAELGVHYVDTTGETHFIKYCIDKYDYLASKSHAIIIPSSGFDSTPSDLAAFIGVQGLKTYLGKNTQAGTSTSAFKIAVSGPSGGTMATGMDILSGTIPASLLAKTENDPWVLSPSEGRHARKSRLINYLPHTSIVGAVFVMGKGNAQLVRRSWGLYKQEALENPEEHGSDAYGDDFDYYEFQQRGSWLSAFALSAGLAAVMFLLRFFPPARWFVRKFWQPGNGPSTDGLEKGSMELTNVTTTSSKEPGPERAVKTVIRCKGEPGYLGTSVIASEIALGLLPNVRERLTHMGRVGGVLTPVSALGMELKERLERTGRFTFESQLIDDQQSGSI